MFMNKLLILLTVFVASLVFALPEDSKQPIEIEAQSVVVDETTGFNEFSGDAEVRQGSLLLLAELIQVQTDNEEVVSVCLLYTSPSPRDATLSRMPSSA